MTFVMLAMIACCSNVLESGAVRMAVTSSGSVILIPPTVIDSAIGAVTAQVKQQAIMHIASEFKFILLEKISNF